MNVNRRDFIRTTSLGTGGMLFGFNYFTACTNASMKKEATAPVDISNLNFNVFNAFIKISDENYITIYSPNPEIGQGVKTAMPMIIAEELDADWKNVFVEQGNLDTKNYNRQLAGGSQSIRHGWNALRQAGATVRQMLVSTAAKKWNVSPEICTTKKGYVYNDKKEKVSYGEIAKNATEMAVPKDVNLKKAKDYTIIGKDTTNVDIDKIITGKPLFGLDFKAKGMKYASVLRPPAFGQSLISYDDSKAKQVNGVIKIVKFDDKVAVIAENTWSAMTAKKMLTAKWSPDDKLESSSDHDRQLDDLFKKGKFKIERKDGDYKKAFKNSDKIVERTYSSPFLPHNCMEPMNFFADVKGDKARLVGPIQTPEGTAGKIARILKIPLENITLEMTRMGGGFGRRLYGDFVEEAALISQKSELPIKVVYSREDDMTAGIYRPPIKYKITASIKNNKITGYRLQEAGLNANMYWLIPNFFPAGAITNLSIETAKVKSDITVGAWRAPFTNFLGYAEQAFFDEVAETMGKDPVQLRIKLLKNVDEGKDSKIEYSASRMIKCIELVVKKSNWGNSKDGVYQGFSAYYSHNTHVAEVAEVTIENSKPVVKKVIVAVDCGVVVNPSGARNQVEGGVIDGIGHAMYGDFRFRNGKPLATNFHQYKLIKMNETPIIETHFVDSDMTPTGLGEPGLPPAGAAVANAIYAATKKRLYSQPFAPLLS